MADEKKKKKVDYSSAWAEARKIVWNARWRLLFGSVLMLISRLASMVLPASTKFIGDEVFTNQRYDLLKWIALAVAISTIVQSTTGFALSQILGVAAQRAITEMRKRVMKHIERLPISYFDSTQSGQLISRIMSDAEGIRNLVGTGLGQILGSLVTAVISIGVLFYLNWRLTTATLVVLVIFGTALIYAFKVLRPIFRDRSVINAEVTGRLCESLGGHRIVKANTAEKREEHNLKRGAHRLFRNIAKSVTGVSAIASFSSLVIGAVAVVMMVIGGSAVQAGTMTLGDFLMYISFTFLLAMPVFELTSVGTQITEALAGLDRIREIMAMTTETEEDSAKESLTDIKGTIDFESVYFEYEPGTPVLKGVSFHSEAGATTALVGSSGSGKSTILSLVLNFIQPTSGNIKIDGKDLNAVKLRDYRKHLGVVLQDNFLFDGTILDNIRFSNPEANLEQIKKMCVIANADEFIAKFPNGYGTIVGERGVKLSGGQRQRIAIARALLKNAPVLVRDEATSALDTESERHVQAALEALMRGRTTLVIAHRLSTVEKADRIVVLEAGRLVEAGTHAQLLGRNGRYARLHRLQFAREADAA